ncbi:hypothetical protein [Candidatus Bodocaedibacter vickermanii]|uniref:Uncharacterized protein n=1 Tax=Candidatus Bodocaedibacter vickermanii TaxID=2741701 RepID=A0A7L9RTU6_9PROT|nr:hypothetical protein CPBP_00567 [Candidatus Paracaedibacteraceae bacterium 'Lake Konstanz']
MNMDSNSLDNKIKETISDDSTRAKETVEQAEKEKLHVTGLKDFYALRNIWAKNILCIIYGLLISWGLLTIAVGRGWLDFSKTPYFLAISTPNIFISVLGLAIIVVKFLFNRKNRP